MDSLKRCKPGAAWSSRKLSSRLRAIAWLKFSCATPNEALKRSSIGVVASSARSTRQSVGQRGTSSLGSHRHMSPETARLGCGSHRRAGRSVKDRIGKKLRSPKCRARRVQPCSGKEVASKASSGFVEKDSHESPLPEVVLSGTIPSVLEWTRNAMDEHGPFTSNMQPEEEDDNSKTLSAREFARHMHAKHNFRLIVHGGVYWKGDVRLWENVCALAARLPSGGRANVVFEAMRRYPSSALVHWGLKTVFGRYMTIGNQKMQRVPLRRDAVAVFSPFTNSRKSLKEWFEDDTHVKMQEVVFHLSAMSEYILRCAFISKQRGEPAMLPSLIEERIQLHRDHNDREVVSFYPCDILTELSDENASTCLEEASSIAHTAVLEGAKAAYKRYGRKRSCGRQREKINLSMLRQPLTAIMDRVVKGLEVSIEDVVRIPIEFDIFHLQASRALRKVVRMYEIILGSHQEGPGLAEAVSKDSNGNGRSHSRRKAYVYREPSEDRDH